jgi:hypothetical protein
MNCWKDKSHVRCVPCHHGMARPQVAVGGKGLQIRRVAANILNKQSRTVNKRWSSSLGVGNGANNFSPYKFYLLRNISKRIRPGLIFWHELSN